MAKVLYSSLVDGVRGRVGGVVFSANAAGPHVKRFNPPVYSRTRLQIDRQAVFQTWGNNWKTLTGSQRDGWNAYAADPAQALIDSLGNTYYLNGYQWFISCGSNLSLVGRNWLPDAPILPIPTPIVPDNLIITAPGTSGNELDVDSSTKGDNDIVLSLNWSPTDARLSQNIKNNKVAIGIQNADILDNNDIGDLTQIFGTITQKSYWRGYLYTQTQEGRAAAYLTRDTWAL